MSSAFDPVWRFVQMRPALSLALITLLLFTSGTHLLPLMDRDEPRFATAAREMNADAEITVPTFNGKERLDKPILIYWGMQLSYAILGTHEFAARLPSVICMVLLVLLLNRWGREWFGPKAGLLAGFSAATTLQFLIHGRWAAADMPMILSIAAAHYGLFTLLGLGYSDARKKARDFGHHDWVPFWIFYLSLGLGFLAKGPIAWASPVLTLLAFRYVFWKDDLPLHRLHLSRGILVVLLVIAPWGIPALIQTNLRFLTVGIGYHVVERGMDPFGGRGWVPGFYLLTALFSLMPWVAFAHAMYARCREKWTVKEAYLVSWIVPVYLMFSIFATQLPHYVLPAFPAISLLFGGIFIGGDIERESLRRGRVFFWSVSGIYFFLILALMALAPLPVYEGPFVQVGMGLAAAILLIGGLVAISTAVWFRGPVIQAGIGIVAVSISLWVAGYALRVSNPAVQMQDLMRSQPAGTRFIASQFTEGSLIFYSGQTWTMGITIENLRQELSKPGPVFIVMLEEDLDLGKWLVHSVRKRFGSETPWPGRDRSSDLAAIRALGLEEHRFEGFNSGRSRWVRVSAMVRGESAGQPMLP